MAIQLLTYSAWCGLVLMCLTAGTAAAADDGPRASPSERLTVHEWGTFTCLQDETGRAIRGINVDDEPVPRFVHRLAPGLILPASEMPLIYYKAVPRLHPFVTMRLETPVIYFYPPAGRSGPLQIDVGVGFHGGWLTEFYPKAHADAPGLGEGNFQFGPITPQTFGTLQWTGLKADERGEFPETDARVWLAPRQVASAPVTTPAGESEQYLFYRGVGHVDAPLKVVRHDTGLEISERFPAGMISKDDGVKTTLWLVHVREDQSVAWQTIENVALTGEAGRRLVAPPVEFQEGDFKKKNLGRLRAHMRQALLADGLFADEADALLATWEVGYFKSPGLRLFFLLPRRWTDAVLPLDLSVPADVTRTMVGRVELVTPQHRKLLEQISIGPVSDLEDWYHAPSQTLRADELQKLWEGKLSFADAGIVPAPDYRAYLDLGRFRNALVLDQLEQRPSLNLKKFASAYRLSYYEP